MSHISPGAPPRSLSLLPCPVVCVCSTAALMPCVVRSGLWRLCLRLVCEPLWTGALSALLVRRHTPGTGTLERRAVEMGEFR